MRVVLKLGFSTGSILGLLAMLASAAAVASPPTIDRQWVSDVSGHDATLNAEINPNGLPTKYKLQIDTTGNFRFDQNDSCPLHPPGILCLFVIVPGDPLAPGLVQPPEFTLAASSESQHVSVRMSDIGAVLQPGTTYHYRAIAANGPQIVEGPEQTFTTPPATGPPTIDRQWVSSVSEHDATLNAEINPNGLLTKYMLQIDTSGNFKFDQNDGCVLHPPGVFCTQALVPGDPLPPGLVAPQEMTRGASYDSEHVSVRMSSIGAVLQPGTTYHYRAIAANGLPFVYGPAQTFTTPPTNEEPPNEDEDAEAPGTPSPEDPPSVAPQPDQLVPPAVPPFASSRPVSNQESSGQRRGDRRRVGRCARKVNRRSSGHRGRGDHRRRHKVGQRKVCARISTARIARR